MTDRVLQGLSPEFARLYPKTGRPSIPPEKLLRALLLQLLYSIRSERQLIEPKMAADHHFEIVTRLTEVSCGAVPSPLTPRDVFFGSGRSGAR